MFYKYLRNATFYSAILFCAGVGAFELDKKAIGEFAMELSKKHNFDALKIKEVLAAAVGSDQIIQLMSKPAEKTKSWKDYKNIFINPSRVSKGCIFWKANKESLDLAVSTYGVPQSIVASLIGIETFYGKITGNHRLIDSLPTLAFHYPNGNKKRKQFFRYQLKEFFLLSREEGFEPKSIRGSYAGALGIPQFMPNNYRQLAVDFDLDGDRDILKSYADSIGSVANYLSHHGWQGGAPIFADATLKRGHGYTMEENPSSTSTSIGHLVSIGFDIRRQDISTDMPASVVRFKVGRSDKYWIVFRNFYSLFRYNPRVKYALVVALLASSIEEKCDLGGKSN